MNRILVCLLLCACPSCLSLDEQWSFAATGTVWPVAYSGERLGGSEYEQGDGAEGLAWVLGLLIVLPLAVDLVLLPITIPHDLIYVD